MSFSSVTTSPNGTVTASHFKRPKPTLSLNYALPTLTAHELSPHGPPDERRRPISPALIPIPILHGTHPLRTSGRIGSDMDVPPAPHLSRSKDAFSPLPMTPGGIDDFGGGGLFDALQKEFLKNEHSSHDQYHGKDAPGEEPASGTELSP